MNKPLDYWLPTRVASPLADEFGDYLERMTKDIKLLLINVLSGVLHRMEVDTGEKYAIYTISGHIAEHYADLIDKPIRRLLISFDEFDSSTIETLVMVLAIAVTEQR